MTTALYTSTRKLGPDLIRMWKPSQDLPHRPFIDFPEEDLTPKYETHTDLDPIDPDHSDLEVTPEIGDNYIRANINLPCGGVVTKGIATAQKHNADNNAVGLVHSNPILDTQTYIVQFNDLDTTK